ncbi:hypothetical protein GY14_08180 [Delftia tsuruhatensis]|nr:hypothetical protein GY14_08180 [Delftia tsuruhatensis]
MPGVTIDREWFSGKDLHDGYDTLQVFRDWVRDPKDARYASELYAGPYSYLSPWHVKGRHDQPVQRRSWLARLLRMAPADPPLAPVRKPQLPAIALCSRLPADQAWEYARRYVKGVP